MRAREIRKVLEELGISQHSKEGKDIRSSIALELLGEENETLKQISKTKFTSSADPEKIMQALALLREEGLIKGDVIALPKQIKKVNQ